MKILMGIPCYNCQQQIGRVLDSVASTLLSSVDEIVVLDNCSRDHTVLTATQASQQINSSKIKIFENLQNYGLGGSFKLLTQYAATHQFDYLLFFHGDDQACTQDAKQMISWALAHPKYEAIWGARFAPEAKLHNYSQSRHRANIILNFIFTLLTGKKIYELGSGVNLYKVTSLPFDQIPSWPSHIAFDINLLLHFISREYYFYPITWNQRDQISTTGNIDVTLKILTMLLRWRLGFKNYSSRNLQDLKYRQVYP